MRPQSYVTMLTTLLLSALGVGACSASAGEEVVGESSSAAVTEASSIVQRPDGRFDVVCLDGRKLTGVTATEVVSEGLCRAPSEGAPSLAHDPFTATCDGEELTGAKLMKAIAPGTYHGWDSYLSTERTVGQVRTYGRRRRCTDAGCAPWELTPAAFTRPGNGHLIRIDGRDLVLARTLWRPDGAGTSRLDYSLRFGVPASVEENAAWFGTYVGKGWVTKAGATATAESSFMCSPGTGSGRGVRFGRREYWGIDVDEVTDTCFRMKVSAKEDVTGGYEESEALVWGTFEL